MATVFRKSQIDKEKLREIILKNPDDLLPGLSFIDQQIGSEEYGIIDFLGVNVKGELIIVNLGTAINEGLLVSSLSQLTWLKENKSLLKRLFFSENIDFDKAPQIVLVGNWFSERFKFAVFQLPRQNIHLIEYKYLIAEGKDAIIFEEIADKNRCECEPAAPRQPQTENIPENRAHLTVQSKDTLWKSQKELLTSEEIAEFLDFDFNLGEERPAA
ncbi:MAG: hypothetical protein HY810_02520 [Candidatus Omnitrophica bacterium]|nr:hypothetical protein [Candidatus Omnitrophota bacterium]